MSDKDLLEKEIANAFGEKLFTLMVETQAQLRNIGLSAHEMLTVQLVCAAARLSIANAVNRATFDETVRVLADREYQPRLEPGVTTRQRGSA